MKCEEELDAITYDKWTFGQSKYGEIECMILCAPINNALNGYVRIPEGHPLYKVKYNHSLCGVLSKEDDYEYPCYSHDAGNYISVHGGVTFSGTWYDEGDWWWGLILFMLGMLSMSIMITLVLVGQRTQLTFGVSVSLLLNRSWTL